MRNIPWYSTYNYYPVNTLSDLANVETSALEEGCSIYVKDTKQVYNLEKNCSLTPDGVDVIGIGNESWVKTTVNHPTSLIVDNLAALVLEPTDHFSDYSLAFVVSLKDFFRLEKTNVTASDGITIVNALDGGKWVRLITRNRIWLRQSTWYIDAVSGNNENDGLIQTRAISTWAEFIRRVSLIPIFETNVTINILSDINEYVFFSPTMVSNGLSCTIVGTRTELFSGTIDTYTQDFTADNPGTITCTTPGWNPTNCLFKFCTITSGTENDARFVIVKNLGGGSARVFPIMKGSDYTPTYVNKANIPTSTFKVWQQTKIKKCALYPPIVGQLVIRDVEFTENSWFNNTEMKYTSSPSTTGIGNNCKIVLYANNGTTYIGDKVDAYGITCQTLYESNNDGLSDITYRCGVLIQGIGGSSGRLITYSLTTFYGPTGIFDSGTVSRIGGTLKCFSYDDSIDHGLIYGTNPGGAAPIFSLGSNEITNERTGGTIIYPDPAYPPRVSNTFMSGATTPIGNFTWAQAPFAINFMSLGVLPSSSSHQFGNTEIIIVGANGVPVGTKYLLPGFIEAATEVGAAFVSPINTIIGKLYISARVAPGVGQSYTINVRINGITRITLALSGTNTSATSTSVYYLAAGQRVTFQAIASGVSLASDITVILRVGI